VAGISADDDPDVERIAPVAGLVLDLQAGPHNPMTITARGPLMIEAHNITTRTLGRDGAM
jgi:hypothetical protein